MNHLSLKHFLLAVLSLSTTRAADVVRWEDLSAKIGHGKPIFTIDLFGDNVQEDRSYTVVTTNREKIRLRAIGVDDHHIWGPGRDIPREQVSEVWIHHRGRFADPLTQAFQGGGYLCEHVQRLCDDPTGLFVAIPASIGYGVASTIPAIAIEGIRRLLPGRVIRVNVRRSSDDR